LMRAIIANEMGKRLGMDYTPRYKTVEVTLNNNYLGVYLLTEQVKISKDRVNAIDSDITGGYLIELDRNPNIDPEDYYFNIYDTPYNLKEPEEASNERKDYIETYMKDAYDALYSSNFKD